jgi:exopolysaccharide biosynthesis polyprenyl glycosylphosphotransferase
MPVEPMLLLTFIDLAIAVVWTWTISRLFRKLYPPRKMILIYDSSKNAQTLVQKMSLRTDKYIICKAVCISTGLKNAIKEMEEYDSVIICDIDHSIKSKLIKYCFKNHKRAYITPSISDIITRSADDVTLFDTPLILSRNGGLSFEQRLLKRSFDILVSLVVLIPISIVMLFCAIAIKLDDGGAILYKQTRLTQNGKKFQIYKFRSMIENAEKNGVPQLAQDDDSRITKVGAVLRKYRLDELPQIINILKGDMSLVGPRPERPELSEKYHDTMPEFDFRLYVKAGLTGYAQVTGKYDTTPYDKLKMDLMYIENYSFLLDLKILFMTVKIILFPVKTNKEELKS